MEYQSGKIPPPTIAIDTRLKPAQAEVPAVYGQDRRILASVTDARGNQADFVENEALIFSRDQNAVKAFLQRWHGVVLERVNPDDAALSMLLVRLDSRLADVSTVFDDLRKSDPLSRGLPVT